LSVARNQDVVTGDAILEIGGPHNHEFIVFLRVLLLLSAD
jgi:hypothetical protein